MHMYIYILQTHGRSASTVTGERLSFSHEHTHSNLCVIICVYTYICVYICVCIYTIHTLEAHRQRQKSYSLTHTYTLTQTDMYIHIHTHQTHGSIASIKAGELLRHDGADNPTKDEFVTKLPLGCLGLGHPLRVMASRIVNSRCVCVCAWVGGQASVWVGVCVYTDLHIMGSVCIH